MNGYLINDFLFFISPDDICIEYDNNSINNILNESLRKYLKSIKEEIDNVSDKWDKYKKITNKYEYINSYVQIDKLNLTIPVCSYKPISRSYFKLIEIINVFKLVDNTNSIQSFHLAEGPGGFIEAMVNYRKNVKDKYYGFTLMDKNQEVPKWVKIQDFLKKNKNIILLYGPKKDGNLYFKHNLDYFKEYHKNKYEFMTADGGFDYSVDFNHQEENSINLIFCEVLYTLVMQKVNGCFVLKVFDTFHSLTVEILYILSYFYREVYMYKPCTSREANSEKYIVCKYFKDIQNRDEIIENLSLQFHKLNNNKIKKIFNYSMNSHFISKIEEINAIYGQQQIENILLTLNYLKEGVLQQKDKVEKIKQTNIKKCIQWCISYKQPFNNQLHDLKIC